MKDLFYMATSTIILAPVLLGVCSASLLGGLLAAFYMLLLFHLTPIPAVRKFIVRSYRAHLRVFAWME